MYRGQRPDFKDVVRLSLSMLHENYRTLPDQSVGADDKRGAYMPPKLKFNEDPIKAAALRREQNRVAR